MGKKQVIKGAQRAVERYLCRIQPLSKQEKDELKSRILLAIQEYGKASRPTTSPS